MSGGNQVSVIADLLSSALNQNAAKWHLAPSVTEIERRVIAKDITLSSYLADLIRAADDFELVSCAELAIVCFRYTGDGSNNETEVDDLNARLLAELEEDGRIFITGTKLNGRQVIRACIINHRFKSTDIDYLVKVIRELGSAS